ncbi:hypothetical protein [Streptomyces sp. NPDC088707]
MNTLQAVAEMIHRTLSPTAAAASRSTPVLTPKEAYTALPRG